MPATTLRPTSPHNAANMKVFLTRERRAHAPDKRKEGSDHNKVLKAVSVSCFTIEACASFRYVALVPIKGGISGPGLGHFCHAVQLWVLILVDFLVNFSPHPLQQAVNYSLIKTCTWKRPLATTFPRPLPPSTFTR